MVPPRTRRTVLLGVGTALLSSTAGCLAADGDDAPTESPDPSTTPPTTSPTPTPPPAGTYADTPDGPEPYPSPLEDDVTPQAATAFAKAFEHARTTNVLHQPDVEDMSVDCRTLHDTSGPSGQYVLATCTGYANYADDVHADWGQHPAFYYVAPGVTIRAGSYDSHYFDCEDVYASSDPTENFAERCSGDDASYRAYNLSPEPHTLSVTVEFLTDSGSEPVLERTYELGSTAGIRQESVTYRRGTYRLTATLETEATATFQWEIQSKPEWDDPPVTILVTPTSGVEIRRVPFPEV